MSGWAPARLLCCPKPSRSPAQHCPCVSAPHAPLPGAGKQHRCGAAASLGGCLTSCRPACADPRTLPPVKPTDRGGSRGLFGEPLVPRSERGRWTRPARGAPTFRGPWAEDVGRVLPLPYPRFSLHTVFPVHWECLFGAAGVSPSPGSPLKSGQNPAATAPDRASVPGGMRAPGTWEVFGERMRSGRRKLCTGTLTKQVRSLPCFPPLVREVKQFSPLQKWFISTFVEVLLTLSYLGPRGFPR